MIGVATLLAYSAFTSLSLAMNRHYRQVWHVEPTNPLRLALRGGGWVLLTASYVACLFGRSWSLALVAWCGALTAAGLALIFLLPHRPRMVALLGVLALLLAVAAWLSG